MEPAIAERYTSEVEREAFRAYGIAADQARRLAGFESFIYEVEAWPQDANSRAILRVGHSARRPVEQVTSELHWIDYLADGGADVARPLPSPTGAPLEAIPDGAGEAFVAAAFSYAQGEAPRRAEQVLDVAEAYGQAIGRMHALTKAYQPPPGVATRVAWDDPSMLDVTSWLPPEEAVAAERMGALIEQLHGLPRDGDAYGLVHGDAHGGNFHVDDRGRLTFFDFDDCCYAWFAHDIAMAPFYAALFRPDAPAFTDAFMRPFLRGYARENTLDPQWLSHIPDFLTLREIGIYALIHRSYDVADPTDGWVSMYMDGRKARIEAGAPYLDYDFASLADVLA
jgi:amicoumacin kinase